MAAADMGKLLYAFKNVRNMEKFLEENAHAPDGTQLILTREIMAYAISLSISWVCLHANNNILKARASAAFERAMSDLESTSDDTWPTLLQHVLVQYVTLLTNLEGPAPSGWRQPQRWQGKKSSNATQPWKKPALPPSLLPPPPPAPAADGCDSGDGGDGGGGTTATTQHRGMVTTRPPSRPQRRRPAAPRKARRRLRGERISELFVGRLIPWHNCHGGAWNETLLITNTRVHIE
jgi:hypothetical protein